MIPTEKLEEIKKIIGDSKNPLVFFDDDADGVSSFLLYWHFKKTGHGQIINATPRITTQYLRKVQEYNPDLVIAVDIAEMDQEFIDGCDCKILWVDHHTPQDRKNVTYMNPMLWEPKDNRPVTYWMYKSLGGPIWIATLGSVGDWHMPEFLDEFREKYPKLMDKKVNTPEEALFISDFSKLFRAYSFNFKGSASEAMQAVKILSRVEEPTDILEQKTKEGKWLYKRFEKVEKEYQALLKTVKPDGDKLLLFNYVEKKYAFTSDVSNYLVAKNPDKFIIVARKKGEEMICSLRGGNFHVLNILNKSLKGVNGAGGGHEKACGCRVKAKDFEKFVENIKSNL